MDTQECYGCTDLGSYFPFSIPSLGGICETCIRKLGCVNCGLNYSAIDSRFPSPETSPDVFIQSDIPSPAIVVSSLFQIPIGAFHSDPPTSPTPTPPTHQPVHYYRQPEDKPAFSSREKLCQPNSVLKLTQQEAASHLAHIETTALPNHPVKNSFDSLFSIICTDTILPGVAETDNTDNMASAVSSVHQLPFLVGRANTDEEDFVILCKWCLERYTQDRLLAFLTFERNQIPSFVNFLEETVIDVDPLMNCIGEDCFGVILSYIVFPHSLLRLSLVCKNWALFLLRESSFGWLKTLVLSKKQVPSIAIFDDELEHMNRVVSDRWEDESILSSREFYDAGPNAFHSDERHSRSALTRFTDTDVWVWIIRFLCSCRGVTEGLHCVERVIFADHRKNYVTDVGALALLKGLIHPSASGALFRDCGFEECRVSDFIPYWMLSTLSSSDATVRSIATTGLFLPRRDLPNLENVAIDLTWRTARSFRLDGVTSLMTLKKLVLTGTMDETTLALFQTVEEMCNLTHLHILSRGGGRGGPITQDLVTRQCTRFPSLITIKLSNVAYAPPDIPPFPQSLWKSLLKHSSSTLRHFHLALVYAIDHVAVSNRRIVSLLNRVQLESLSLCFRNIPNPIDLTGVDSSSLRSLSLTTRLTPKSLLRLISVASSKLEFVFLGTDVANNPNVFDCLIPSVLSNLRVLGLVGFLTAQADRIIRRIPSENHLKRIFLDSEESILTSIASNLPNLAEVFLRVPVRLRRLGEFLESMSRLKRLMLSRNENTHRLGFDFCITDEMAVRMKSMCEEKGIVMQFLWK